MDYYQLESLGICPIDFNRLDNERVVQRDKLRGGGEGKHLTKTLFPQGTWVVVGWLRSVNRGAGGWCCCNWAGSKCKHSVQVPFMSWVRM